MSTKSTKKASKRNPAAETARTTGGVETVVNRGGVGVVERAVIAGVTLEGGMANIAVRLDVPPPTMKENPKWPFTQWYVDNLTKQLQKDLRRIAQTIANAQYGRVLVEARTAKKGLIKRVSFTDLTAPTAQPQAEASAAGR